MKRLLILQTLTALALYLMTGLSYGQAVKVPGMQGLGKPEHHFIESPTTKDRYHLLVRKPANYNPKAKYPTVYLLDGGVTFPLLSAYYHYLRYTEEIEQMIIVGISYGADGFKQGNMRSRDFTAKSAERDYWGGAPDFQKLISTHIFPLIERQYASDAKRRIIFGQSLGGQFVLHTAMHQPDMFMGYIASNPALHRNLDWFLQPAKAGEKKPLLYVGAGSKDHVRFRKPAKQWIKHWQQVKDKPWHLKVENLEGQTHVSAAPESFRLGIQWIFTQ